jgi:hypothetical protein
VTERCAANVTVYEETDEGWCWGQSSRVTAGVGWLPRMRWRAGSAPTHAKVSALRTLVYPPP